MAEITVDLDGVRQSGSEDNANGGSWVKVNISGPAAVAEPQLVYQGTNTMNVKNGNSGGGNQGYLQFTASAGTTSDMVSAAGSEGPLFFLKGYIADFGDLEAGSGCRVEIGSDATNHDNYVIAGSDATKSVYETYPPQGGYILCSINPEVSDWHEGTDGSPVLSAVAHFSFGALFNVGAAKSENQAFDAIDVGRGLILRGGDGGSTDGIFSDFVSADQTNTTNRWGVVSTKSGAISSCGKLTIGDSTTLTEFTDDGGDLVIFPDGYHGPGDLGVKVNIDTSSVAAFTTSQLIGRGVEDPSDTRPDFIVSGVSGTVTLTGTVIDNFRNVTFTSAVTVSASDIECSLLTQSSCLITDSTIIRTVATANIACLQDPLFGTSTFLNNTDFVQAGTGHAIEVLATATLTNIGFQGYGGTPGTNSAAATGATDAAILNDTGSHVVLTIVAGGDTPSVRNGAGAVTTIVAAVNVTFTGMKDGTEVRIYDAGTGAEIDGIEEATDGSPDNRSFTWSDQAGNEVNYVIHNVTQETIRVEGFPVPSIDTSIPIQQRIDRNYDNP
jgi:hypothetical protein